LGKTLAIEADGLRIRQNAGLLLGIDILGSSGSGCSDAICSAGYDEFKSGKYVGRSLWNQPIIPAQNRLLRETRNEA
jgi:hypothetical protein